jgi:hypothetical protein
LYESHFFSTRNSHFRIPDFSEFIFGFDLAGAKLLDNRVPSGSSCSLHKDERLIHNAGFSVRKQFLIIPASSVHLDPTDAAKSHKMRLQNETSPGKNQSRVSFSLFGLDCELYVSSGTQPAR